MTVKTLVFRDEDEDPPEVSDGPEEGDDPEEEEDEEDQDRLGVDEKDDTAIQGGNGSDDDLTDRDEDSGDEDLGECPTE